MELSASLRTTQKSRLHPSAVDQIISRAVYGARGIPHPMAVLAGREVIGIVRGHEDRDIVSYKPTTHRQWCGFGSYADLENAMRQGRVNKIWFHKNINNWALSNIWYDAWCVTGTNGGPGDYSGTANTARRFSSSTPGSLYVGVPDVPGGASRHLVGWSLTGIQANNSVNSYHMLYDRVIAYDGGSITTSVTSMTNTLTATRYIGSGSPGLSLMITGTTADTLGATASAVSAISYTNEGGTSGRSVPTTEALDVSPSAAPGTSNRPARVLCPWYTAAGSGWGPFIPTAAGDAGISQIDSYSFTANNTGSICFALVKPLAILWSQGTSSLHRVDMSRAVFAMEKIYSDACLSFAGYQSTSNSINIIGNLVMAWS